MDRKEYRKLFMREYRKKEEIKTKEKQYRLKNRERINLRSTLFNQKKRQAIKNDILPVDENGLILWDEYSSKTPITDNINQINY